MYRNQIVALKKIIEKNADFPKLAVKCRTNKQQKKEFPHYSSIISSYSTHQLLATRPFYFDFLDDSNQHTLLSRIDIFKGNHYVTQLSLYPENSLFDWYNYQPIIEVIGDNDRELLDITTQSIFLNFGTKRTSLSHQLLKHIGTNIDERLEFSEMEDRIQHTLRLGYFNNK